MPTSDWGLARIAEASAANTAVHRGALTWRESVPIPLGLVWLGDGWATRPENADLLTLLLSPGSHERIRRAMERVERGWRSRASSAMTERFALPVAITEVFRLSAIQDPGCQVPEHRNLLHLAHTPLGQPIVRWRAEMAAWARNRGIRARDLHISFSHDGDAHLALAACARGLCGIGIDIVHLPRLRGERKESDYLRRFARHFMSDEEFSTFGAASGEEDEAALRIRVAAHFSLMEAASKAFGTGLKIGGGMGGTESLPKQSIGIEDLGPRVVFMLGPEAHARAKAIGARRLTGYWASDQEYLVSACLLWRDAQPGETNSDLAS